MAKTVQYPKGAVIFFEGERPKNIYILQSGCVETSYLDPDTRKNVVTVINCGEFFGVKNMLINMPHLSQANAIENSTVILLTLQEFLHFIENDNKFTLNMFRAVCNQLKDLHAKLYTKFGAKREISSEIGIFHVAKAFSNTGQVLPCIDVCKKFLELYPESKFQEDVRELLEESRKIVADIPEINTSIILADTREFEMVLPDSFSRYEKSFPAKQMIFSEFEKGDSVFLVMSGIVRSAKCIRGRNMNLSLATPGEFFALNGLINMPNRDVTCVTIGPTKVLEFPLEDFDSIALASPKIAYMILKLLAKRVHDDRLMLRNLYIPDLPTRLKDMFVTLDMIGLCEKIKGTTRKIFLTAHDISTWTNTPAETIKEELELLEKQGVITITDEGWIIVKDIEEARRVSEGVRIVNN